MLATVIITQNIIVSQAARQQKNNIVMCTDKDTGELITVYFDKNQTSSDLDLEDEPDAVGSSATAVCSPMPSVQQDTVETSDPESTVTKIEVTHIGKTASALTDSFITMMQFISIGTFIIFAVLSLIASWLVGSRLSKRVAKISKQVEALKPGDLDARIAPDAAMTRSASSSNPSTACSTDCRTPRKRSVGSCRTPPTSCEHPSPPSRPIWTPHCPKAVSRPT